MKRFDIGEVGVEIRESGEREIGMGINDNKGDETRDSKERGRNSGEARCETIGIIDDIEKTKVIIKEEVIGATTRGIRIISSFKE